MSPSPTDTNLFFEINRAGQNISKKHRPANKETLNKNTSNNKDINNKITLHNTSILPSPTNLESTKINNRQKHYCSNTSIHDYKKHHTKAKKCR